MSYRAQDYTKRVVLLSESASHQPLRRPQRRPKMFPRNVISMRCTLSTCTRTKSLTIDAKPDDSLYNMCLECFPFYVLNSQMYIAYMPLPVTSATTNHEVRALKRVFGNCRMDPVRYSPCAASSPKKSIRHPTADMEISIKGPSV